jgi:glycosyltransferase involved in cell wall biosynthesis
MNLLINCPFKFTIKDFDSAMIGGIESLNIDLVNKFAKNKYNVTFSTIFNEKMFVKNRIKSIPIEQLKKDPKKFNFDYIISSNDSTIFDYFPKSKKFLWLHNKLQIEKAIRKKQFFSILRTRPTAVFVSNYLDKLTSSFFFFKKRITINNFLLSNFKLISPYKNKRKPIFVWSVARNRGLQETIQMWIDKIYPISNNARFFILGNNKFYSKFSKSFLESKNIFFKGRVDKKTLKKIYLESTAMICLGYDETFCLNALEANACGLPVLSFGKSALSKFIINKYNGFKVNNFNELSLKIIFLLNQTAINKKKIISNCYNHSKKFSLLDSFFYWKKLLK